MAEVAFAAVAPALPANNQAVAGWIGSDSSLAAVAVSMQVALGVVQHVAAAAATTAGGRKVAAAVVYAPGCHSCHRYG